jgi:hypothetical protein
MPNHPGQGGAQAAHHVARANCIQHRKANWLNDQTRTDRPWHVKPLYQMHPVTVLGQQTCCSQAANARANNCDI